ncbi:hypothetical protein, partial [Klebsiella pneumoniae]|uniref:hypothetical protein n=1 Tax=Klebsiella pneumoniae TaxID=573 RepID=UPI00226FD68B
GCGAELGSYCPAAPAVAAGRVHVHLSTGGKLVARAFDARTGEPLWSSRPVSWGYQVNQLSSAKVARGLSLLFGNGPDFDPHARPGFAL